MKSHDLISRIGTIPDPLQRRVEKGQVTTFYPDIALHLLEIAKGPEAVDEVVRQIWSNNLSEHDRKAIKPDELKAYLLQQKNWVHGLLYVAVMEYADNMLAKDSILSEYNDDVYTAVGFLAFNPAIRDVIGTSVKENRQLRAARSTPQWIVLKLLQKGNDAMNTVISLTCHSKYSGVAGLFGRHCLVRDTHPDYEAMLRQKFGEHAKTVFEQDDRLTEAAMNGFFSYIRKRYIFEKIKEERGCAKTEYRVVLPFNRQGLVTLLSYVPFFGWPFLVHRYRRISDEIVAVNRDAAEDMLRQSRMLSEMAAKETELLEMEKRAKALESIRHDIRTYVGGLRGCLNSLNISAQKLAVDLKKNFGRIFPRYSNLLTSIGIGFSAGIDEIEDLSDLLKNMEALTSGEQLVGVKKECYDLHDVLDQAIKFLPYTCPVDRKDSRLEIIKNYGDGAIMLDGYKPRVKEMAVNLMRNAAEAMNWSGRITVATRTENSDAYITVSDTGPGMGADIVQKIRKEESFSTKPGDNRGHGWSVIRAAIASNHGQYEIESAPGQGTKITVKFKLGS